MIDLKFLRENPEVVKQNIRNKFQDQKLPLVDEVIELDAERRATQQQADDLKQKRNSISKQIGALMAQGKKAEAEEALKVAISEISKAANKGIYHKNTAARKISRLTVAVNKIGE